MGTITLNSNGTSRIYQCSFRSLFLPGPSSFRAKTIIAQTSSQDQVEMIWSTLLLALSAATGALAQNNATEPKAPQLTFLYSANATVGPLIDYGKGPWGQRVALPITGGTFSGPKLAGTPLSSLPTSICTPNSISVGITGIAIVSGSLNSCIQ
ncbi:uncharacterized protein RSE6_01171 [Rhynchosporium secalis]|uniref:Uncharacterized protein n=1 Tax=Rhynchosporium secalis TaxID=38038 RepID=A0A1E1LX34_RHYSE|nr:uncharacterized protein RSE6_01171 [Rhynchosporium secalis]